MFSLRKLIPVIAVAGILATPAMNSGKAAIFEVPSPPPAAAPTVPVLPFLVMGGAASTMINAALIYGQECRELTSNEAIISFFLPGVGIIINAANQQNNQCNQQPARRRR